MRHYGVEESLLRCVKGFNSGVETMVVMTERSHDG